MKKGIFTPLLVLFTLLILISLAFTITKVEKQKQEIITGEIPLELIKMYNEGEKLSFYLDESVRISLKNTLETLKENAGYPMDNNCERINGITVWNSKCVYFDIHENFNKQFKEEINKYTKLYPKEMPEPEISTSIVQFNSIKFTKDAKSLLIEKFSAEYIINKEIKYNYPDLDIYKIIYSTADSCNTKPHITDDEINACIENMESIPNTKVTRNNDYLEIENNGVKLLINVKEPMQPPQKPITIA